jgi:hypothetical protein
MAGANQVQIPIIQTDSKDLVQAQQNTNKVLRNINNQMVVVQDTVSQLGVLGEIRLSPLTLTQWQAEAGTNWIAANGQSSVGTEYASKFSLNTVPTISVTGTNAYIRVN